MIAIATTSRLLRTLAAVAALLVLVAAAAVFARFTGDDARADPTGKPVPLTAEQCEAAGDIVNGLRADRARVADRIGRAGAAAMDAAVAESAHGLPPDARRTTCSATTPIPQARAAKCASSGSKRSARQAPVTRPWRKSSSPGSGPSCVRPDPAWLAAES